MERKEEEKERKEVREMTMKEEGRGGRRWKGHWRRRGGKGLEFGVILEVEKMVEEEAREGGGRGRRRGK